MQLSWSRIYASLNSSAATKEGAVDLKVTYDIGWEKKIMVQHITANQGIVF